jgi:RNA polymerase sigma factor (sigma-70 family)
MSVDNAARSEPDAMKSRSSESALCQVRTLFEVGAAGALTDGQLLEQFLGRRDGAAEVAFAALIRRHGPMVLGVCRGVLGDRQEAEDAFQATFLILVRRAGSVRKRDSLGPWLHGVARRVAVRAKVRTSRRRGYLQRLAGEVYACERPPEGRADEVVLLREEVERLPARFRAPIVLCHLEGLSYEGAARSLGLTEGAVRGRLVRGRAILRSRLERRGITGAAVLAAPDIGRAAALPAALAEITGRAAMRVAAGEPCTGVVSTSVGTLLQGAIQSMNLFPWKTVAAGLLPAGALCFGAALLAPRGSIAQPPPAAAAEPAPVEDTEIDEALIKRVPGRVVKALDVTKDSMVLAYLPDWNFGNVDNIGVEGHDGGVRTYIKWADVPPQEADAPGRRFLLAIYARKTVDDGRPGPILGLEVTEKWPEIISWKTQPETRAEPAVSFPFEPGKGWKLFDVTPLVAARAKAGKPGHGIVLRFQKEDSGRGEWSGYQLVSREASNGLEDRRPRLLIVDPASK